jgi:hypothetical protein
VSGPRASLVALALTAVIEFAVIALIQRRDVRRLLLAAILVNACTEPLANALYQSGVAPWLVIEIAVALAEAPLYRALLASGWRRAGAIALCANAASALTGVLLFGMRS